MSIKTIMKRISLVTIAALGFGMISVIPAGAAVTAISDATLALVASPTDPTLTIGSISNTAKLKTYNVYTRNSTVLLADLKVTVAHTGTGSDLVQNFLAPGALSVGSGKTAAAYLSAASLSSTVAAAGFALPGSGGALTGSPTGITATTLAASTTGTTYTFVAQLSASTLGTIAANDATIQITVYQSSTTSGTATLGTASTTLAGRIGQQVTISPTAPPDAISVGSFNFAQFSVAASITTQPAPGTGQSLVYPTLAAASAMASLGYVYADTGLSAGSTALSTSTTSIGNSTTVATINYSTNPGVGITAGTSQNAIGTITFTPVVAGTYTLVVWNETSTSGSSALSGAESSQTFTINVAAGVSSIAMTAINSTSSISGSNGALVKLQLKDAAGNAATLAPGESVTVTPSGSAIIAKVNNNAASSTAGQAWNLSAANFNSSGVAWINVTDAVAESPTITASIGGASSSSISLTFKSTVTVAGTAGPYNSSLATGVSSTAGGSKNIPIGASTLSWRLGASTGSSVIFTVTESLNGGVGTITGYTTALAYDAVGAGDTDLGYASVSVTATTSVAGQSYTIISVTNTSTVTSIANQAGVLSVTPSTVNAVAGSTNTFTVLLKDRFLRKYANQAVTVSVAGKNASTSSTTLSTDANGNATFSLTDANTNTAVTDTITFSAGSSVTATVSYGTNTVSSVKVASDDYTVAGTANDTVSPKAIATGYAGAQGGARTVTATVKNAAGALLAGVPVTFSVSGTGAAVTSTTKTVYTGVSGTASASVYGWITGTYTVTATAGGVSGTATQTFYSTGNDSVRTVSASAVGNQITGKATDRYGNPVQGATLYAKITSGTGNIGGALTAQGTTDSKGEVVWVVSEANSTVTVSNISFSSPAGTVVGQTGAAKGYDIGGAGATALTAATVGTTTTDETGVGSSYDAAGVSSATADAVVTANSDAIDAANEATDAANAATDAANAAAEAADAATAAAQDAQAAVAALATEVAAMISGIKAQLTRLANLVVKIQKKVRA